jgi:hypothetical protein
LRERRSVTTVTPFANRQLGDPARVDHLPELGRGAVDCRRGGRDRHFVGDGADLQGRIHREQVRDVELDVVADELAEAREADRDPVGAGVQKRRPITALIVRRRRRDDAGRDVEHLDGGAGNGGAARVDDAALNRAARILRRCAGGDEHDRRERTENDEEGGGTRPARHAVTAQLIEHFACSFLKGAGKPRVVQRLL